MKKILHLFGKMDRAGAETRTIEVMRKIDQSKYRFDYLSCSGQVGDYDNEIEELGGTVYKQSIYSIKFIPNLYKLLKENNYDIVHSHIHYVSGLIMLIAWFAGTKQRITHFRTAGNITNNKTVKNRLLKMLVSNFSTNILAVNNYTMDCVWGGSWKNSKKFSVLNNGIESKYISLFSPENLRKEFDLGDSKIILHVGRIEKEKNHVFLINLFASYLKINPNTKLILVGRNDTQEAASISKLILELGLDEKVILTGVRSDVDAFLNLADIMVFPSLWEGLPGAVLEALSAGCPVVASNIGCHQEIKKHINSLLVVDLEDSVDKWICSIGIAIENSERNIIRKQFINSPYYIDKYVKGFTNLYN